MPCQLWVSFPSISHKQYNKLSLSVCSVHAGRHAAVRCAVNLECISRYLLKLCLLCFVTFAMSTSFPEKDQSSVGSLESSQDISWTPLDRPEQPQESHDLGVHRTKALYRTDLWSREHPEREQREISSCWSRKISRNWSLLTNMTNIKTWIFQLVKIGKLIPFISWKCVILTLIPESLDAHFCPP